MDTKNIAKEIYDELGMDGIYKEEKTVSRIRSILEKYDTTLKNESCGCDINRSIRVGEKDYCLRCVSPSVTLDAMRYDFQNKMNDIFFNT